MVRELASNCPEQHLVPSTDALAAAGTLVRFPGPAGISKLAAKFTVAFLFCQIHLVECVTDDVYTRATHAHTHLIMYRLKGRNQPTGHMSA